MWPIVLLLALSTVSFADEYTPVDWITLTEDGGIKAQVGSLVQAIQSVLSRTLS